MGGPLQSNRNVLQTGAGDGNDVGFCWRVLARFRPSSSALKALLACSALSLCTHADSFAEDLSGMGEVRFDSGTSRLKDALEVLSKVSSGKKILQEAQVVFGLHSRDELLDYLELGDVSRTDAVLTRHFNPATQQEERERKVKVILKRNQPLADLVFDLAHELTHAVQKPSWDPYDPELTAGKYIYAAIEGRGGEVDAVTTECQVGFELALQYGTSMERCRRYRRGEQVDREKVKADFYRVGEWSKTLERDLGEEAKQLALKSESPMLYSSTGNAPYPVALYREFTAISSAACKNSYRRLELSRSTQQESAESGRAPAGVLAGSKKQNDGVSPELAEFLNRRCKMSSSGVSSAP